MAIRIFIDQGHNPSGPNTGAEGNGLIEQDITYTVGLYLAELLSADPEEVTALELITMGFGIANYFLQNGQPDKAYDLMERVVKAGDENDCYFAFAYLASKVDLAHKG